MKTTILVAGGTGNLGGRIIDELIRNGADVKALVRSSSDQTKLTKLRQKGVSVIEADLFNLDEVQKACAGVRCVLSALAGLKDVIIDMQAVLLQAAVAAGVPRFIPSDFSSDFTKLTPGENRNFDLRRTFHKYLDEAPIKATSILNGAFGEILAYNTPLLDFKNKTVSYWENPDWRIDFTTMDDTAAFTAAAAIEPETPEILRVASFQVSPNELAHIAAEVTGSPFKLIRMGSLEELAAYNRSERAAHPEGEQELYPRWQSSQYMQSMFSVQLNPLDNNRYDNISWTSARDFLGFITKSK